MGDSVRSTEPSSAQEEPEESKLKRRLILGFVLILSAVAAWFFGAAVVPRWWAQKVGGQVDGSLSAGSFLGVVVGFVFTVLPLIALRAGWKFRAGWRRWIKFVVLALVLAAPNLATLGIVIGNGNAAHAGERILDVEGPGFRGGSLAGAIGAVILMGGLSLVLRSRRRNKHKAAELKAKLEAKSD